MSLIQGTRGLIYFVHQFKPTFREAALLDDPEMLAAVTALNQQITGLAPVLNTPSALGFKGLTARQKIAQGKRIPHWRGERRPGFTFPKQSKP